MSNKSKKNNNLESRFKESKLSIYDKDILCKKIQPHYTISDLVNIYSVSRDTIERALEEENVKIHWIRGTKLVPASEIPKFIKDY
jgi:hypothetical protein